MALTPVVQKIIDGLGAQHVFAEYFNNAGGIMVVRVGFGEWLQPGRIERYEVLISGRDESLEMYDDDRDFPGLLATLRVYDDEGSQEAWEDRYGPTILFESSHLLVAPGVPDDDDDEFPLVLGPGESIVDINAEAVALVDAVVQCIRKVVQAEFEFQAMGVRSH